MAWVGAGVRPMVQLVGTLAISLAPLSGVLKAPLMLLWWGLTLERLRRSEILLFAGVNLLFFPLNVAAVRNGLFTFHSPDVLGLPLHECFMWGFYVLHVRRTVCRTAAPVPGPWGWVLLAAFGAAFALVKDSGLLLAATASLVLAGLLLFREAEDRLSTLSMILLGTSVEAVGVGTGQWSYPGGGVPLWSLSLWGGVGLFLRRLDFLFTDLPGAEGRTT